MMVVVMMMTPTMMTMMKMRMDDGWMMDAG